VPVLQSVLHAPHSSVGTRKVVFHVPINSSMVKYASAGYTSQHLALKTYKKERGIFDYKSTSSDLIYRVMSVWITRRANYFDLK
jgi:hypothetical protein